MADCDVQRQVDEEINRVAVALGAEIDESVRACGDRMHGLRAIARLMLEMQCKLNRLRDTIEANCPTPKREHEEANDG